MPGMHLSGICRTATEQDSTCQLWDGDLSRTKNVLHLSEVPGSEMLIMLQKAFSCKACPRANPVYGTQLFTGHATTAGKLSIASQTISWSVQLQQLCLTEMWLHLCSVEMQSGTPSSGAKPGICN